MANFTALKTAINNAIKTNGNEEITGAILQAILDAMVETLGDSAINDLENAITTEVTNRENAVGDVAADLAAEVQARQALDYNVNNRINAEEYNRQNADAALSQTMSQGFQTLGSQMTALNAAISALNAAYQNGFLYGGIATPSSSPSNNKCFYIALQGGTYTNFGGVGVVEGINIIKNDSGWKVEHIYDQTTLLNELYLLRQQVIRAISSIDPIVIQGDVTNAPDEEDLTSDAQHLLKFKDRAYSPLNFSGLGMKILRKNIAPLSDSAAFNGFVEGVTAEETLAGSPELIFWDRMNTRFVGIKDGIYYAAWTDDDNYVPVSTSLVYMYNGTPYQWTGSDFIVDETEVPNLVNCLTQDMINEANTIYIIHYDYTLKEDITIPANCVLEFDGGSISGEHTITGQNTGIEAGLVKIFGTDVAFGGNWNLTEIYPENFGAKGDGISDDTDAFQSAIEFATKSSTYSGCTIKLRNACYIVNGVTLKPLVNIVGLNIGESVLKANTECEKVLFIPHTSAFNRIENLSIAAESLELNVDGIDVEFNDSDDHTVNPFGGFKGLIPKNSLNTYLHELVLNNISFRDCNNGINSVPYPSGSTNGLGTGLFKISKIICYHCNTGIAGSYIDGEFDNLDISYSVQNGINASFANCRMTNIKTWFNGGTEEAGDNNKYSVIINGSRNIFSDLDIQDSYSNGLKLIGNDNVFSNVVFHRCGITERNKFHILLLDWNSNRNTFINIVFLGSYVTDTIINRGTGNILKNYNFGFFRDTVRNNYDIPRNDVLLLNSFNSKTINTTSKLNPADCVANKPIYFSKNNIGFIVTFVANTNIEEAILMEFANVKIIARKDNDKYKFVLKDLYAVETLSTAVTLDNGETYTIYGNFDIFRTALNIKLYKKSSSNSTLVNSLAISNSNGLSIPSNGQLKLFASSFDIIRVGLFDSNINPDILTHFNILGYKDTILNISTENIYKLSNRYGVSYVDGNITPFREYHAVMGNSIKIPNLIPFLSNTNPCVHLEIIAQHFNDVTYAKAILTLKKWNNAFSCKIENFKTNIFAYTKGDDVYIKVPTPYAAVSIFDCINGISWKFEDAEIPNDATLTNAANHIDYTRPTNVNVGFQYYDMNLKKPIWAKENNQGVITWIDATGATV